MTSSLSFDRAAEFYDRTRADPPWVQQAIADSLRRETNAAPSSRLLDIGIGTGRIALPLAERGLNIVGLDLSIRMMERLRATALAHTDQIRLLQADAVSLPFADESFDVAFAVHVFHVIADWRRALREARRILKTRGKLLISYHYRGADSVNRVLRQKMGELARARNIDTRRPGIQSAEEMLAELEKWGKPRIVLVAAWTQTTTPQIELDEIENKITTDTWAIPDELMPQLMPQLRAWARTRYPDLTRPETYDSRFDWMIVEK